MNNQTQMQQSRGVEAGTYCQQEARSQTKAGPLKDQHGCKSWGCEAGIHVTSREENSCWSQAEKQDWFVRQIFVF